MSILLAVDDGLTNANLNMADVFFLIATAFGALAGLAYVAGFPVAGTDPDLPAPHRYARYSHWAAAFVAFAVACIAFGWFLL